MVRMDHPSPFQVGREFVRQYYSLLNKAPEILHRFYGVNSSYVHGNRYCNGEPEEEVVGQMAIHKKITSLQFKECHTKVYQVDAHATIGNGVVVQVIGELSNNRKPLRRFMQTFVLAPQGDNPYKFYVHNDIFRYEDEVYQDEVRQEHLEEEQELDEEVTVQQPPPTQYDNHIGSPNQVAQIINDDLEPRLDSQPVTSDDQDSPALAISPPNRPESETESDHVPDPEPVDDAPRAESPVYPISNENEEPELDETTEKDVQEAPDNGSSIPAKDPEPVQPYSWAALASKNTPAQHNIQQGTVVKVNQSNDNSSLDQQKPQPQRSTRPPTMMQRDGSGEGVGDQVGRRGSRYPDNQQIFVGNLPLEITEAELREHFSKFGEIVEVRINHSNTSNPSFGFIIFEDHKAVEEVLRVMPTSFKNNKRINIEEKKQRAMSRDGGRRPGGPGRWDSGRDNNRGGRLQQRGPPRRDWGGSREGQRPNNFPPRR